ncbi:hypothetical protein RB200_29660 [Streptomyces sp. PmtG]
MNLPYGDPEGVRAGTVVAVDEHLEAVDARGHPLPGEQRAVMHLGNIRALFHEITDDVVEGKPVQAQWPWYLCPFDGDAAEQLDYLQDGVRRFRWNLPLPRAAMAPAPGF